MATLMHLWNDWELQILVLLSFMLQVFLFFAGRHRRRSTNTTLRFLMWFAYLLADFIAVYALGQLSRQKTDTYGVGESQHLAFFWTPFLLIHLGGQDTITAFSMEDNELWLRHLLNLLVQVGLALYVFWKSEARNQFLAPAIFAFIAGFIKYGERTWALRSGSQKALRSSIPGEVRQFPELEAGDQELEYFTVVKFALTSSPGVRNVFVGRKIEQMEERVKNAFCGFYNKESYKGEYVFKILEVELGMMYDNLYTKAKVIRTWAGAVLRFVTLISLLVAFALFIIGSKQRNPSKVDVAITYLLFIGAFCLELCSICFMVVMSPWTWDVFSSWNCRRLAHAAWYVFKIAQPYSRPLWSNSMGQYNFLDSCFSDNVIGKIMSLVGAKELWRNFRHTKFVDINKETSNIFFEDSWFVEVFGTIHSRGMSADRTSGVGAALDFILRKPFEEAILALHIYTDIFLHRYMNPTNGNSCQNTRDTRHLMNMCRTLSGYMCYLLVLHPEMLPVSGSVRDVLDNASDAVKKVTGTSANKDKFLQELATERDLISIYNPVFAPWYIYRRLVEEAVHSHESLRVLARAWVAVLHYAAAKSRGEAHAKQLSMGGEFLTFVWLHLAHRTYGDQGILEIEIIRPSDLDQGGRKMFVWG